MEKEKKPIYQKWWFWLIIVLVILLIIGVSGSNNETSKTTLTTGETTNTSTEENKKQENVDKKYNVGEIYEDSSIAIKYVSLNDNFTGYNEYADVKSGCKIIKADFEFENVGSSDFLASSYDFNCYADGYDCESFYSVDDSSFSSNLSAGKKTKGSVYFQVPENATEITLEYETNIWIGNKIEFLVK